MNDNNIGGKLLTVTSVVLWVVIILLPLLVLFVQVLSPSTVPEAAGNIYISMFRSFGLSAAIAAAAVLLGWVPGQLLGTCRTRRDLLLLLLLMPLVLPRYVLYYAWTLMLSPTTTFGAYLSGRPEVARFVGTFTSSLVLIFWYWPLAALLLAQGWRNIDRQIRDSASLDASSFGIFRKITLPLLGRPLLIAFSVCFVLSLSEFATFHLAGIRTIGTELAVLYELTSSEGFVARAAWPVTIVALLLAIIIGKSSRSWIPQAATSTTAEFESYKRQWIIVLALIVVSLVLPLLFFIGNMTDTQALRQFLRLHPDELGWSLFVSAVAAVLAYLIAFGALSLGEPGRGSFYRLLSLILRTTVFFVMFIPASLVGVSLLKMLAVLNVTPAIRQGWYLVSTGQAARFAGIAMILLLLTQYAHREHLSEMASLDGASRLQTWWYVHLPHTWPVFIGTFILIVMLGVTELSATMVLLPAGLPNFAQRLLNQMHYARDQQVIASCLVLIFMFLFFAVIVVLLLRLTRVRWLLVFAIIAAGVLTGCDKTPTQSDSPKVLNTFGQTGQGQAEFVYPRAIDLNSDGSLFIVDKTGRIQRLSPEGEFLNCINMPLIETGKPTGLSVAPNGNLYVADTHYHRIVIFSPKGKLIDEFGKFGEGDGCFIYPTDVAFSKDDKIFVSEYGGNDRISAFTEQGDFLFCFGSPGNGPGQFARPSALCVDSARKCLYVADACNHRIAIYDLEGNLFEYIGSAGRSAGQLRYPYDLALLDDGTLVVCEYGNNRLQLFGPDRKSLAVCGRPGRQSGQLAYPWGVAVDAQHRAFIVDAGNNRVQVWQL
ncbi:MAG: 6-bladed beta-propeller [Sedimentisphaerales bacterium]|nr:6-bladed beta-propeller [Sedimentisphaerales bacterium]